MAGLQLILLFTFHHLLHHLVVTETYIDKLTAQQIHQNLNGISPCTNFWSFACGSFSHPNYVDNFEWVEDKYAQDMKEFMHRNLEDEQQPTPHLVQQMRNYYEACTKAESKEWAWPWEENVNVTTSTLSTNDWPLWTAKLRKYGLNGVFLDEQVEVAYNDSLRQVLQLKMPNRGNSFTERQLLWAYQSKDGEQGEELLQQLQQLQMKHQQQEELTPTVMQSWTFNELSREIPQIDWKMYLKELLEMPEEEQLQHLRFEVSHVEYLKELGLMMRRFSMKSILLYLRVRFMIFFQLAQPKQNDASSCIHHMRALLPLGMNYLYDRYVYLNRAVDTLQLQQIFSGLRATFERYLDANRLQLSPKELTYVRAKLRAIKLKIGNLPEEKSAAYFEGHYGKVNFSRNSYLGNLGKALKLRFELQHANLLEPHSQVNLSRYYVNDDVLKARTSPYFENERNTLTVPLIFLQWPLYDHRQHDIFHYSLIGFVLAHELNHAFEQEGILYDFQGNESPLGLEILENKGFQLALKCAARTPTASLKERLADFNGLQLAYDTFFGLNHDSQRYGYLPYEFEAQFPAPQLFYLSFAQFFCGTLPPVSGHDTDDMRVNLSVMNLQQFSNDFRCPAQQGHESASCEMWRPVR